jgi:hypothetical protein
MRLYSSNGKFSFFYLRFALKWLARNFFKALLLQKTLRFALKVDVLRKYAFLKCFTTAFGKQAEFLRKVLITSAKNETP